MKTKQKAGGGRVQKREDSRNTERERERERLFIFFIKFIFLINRAGLRGGESDFEKTL